MTTPDLLDPPLETIRFHGLKTGPKLLILGSVHGNETCGPNAIAKAIEDCRAGRVPIQRGEVTFLPVANPKAFRQKTREGDRNLNRDLRERPQPADNEDRIGNRLSAILREHDMLLDIHSFSGEGVPFVFFGPEDNRGPLEPFRHAAAELAFAACLGVELMIHGWLDIYVRLIAAREQLDLPRLAVTEGFGTTEFMRFAGGYGVTLECGQHDDSTSPDIGYAAIRNVLDRLGLTDEPPPEPARRTVVQMDDLVICEAEGDRLVGSWRTGDQVAKDTPIAQRADGKVVTMPRDGFMIFPNPKAKPGEGICYLGTESARRL